MSALSRLTAGLTMLLLSFLWFCPLATAFPLQLRFAPLGHTPRDADAFAPSTSVPVSPQFFRILVTRKQVMIGAEDPYVNPIKLTPPIRFKPLPRSTSEPVTNVQSARPMHHLRGPEALLLRRPPTVVGKTFQ